MGKTEEREYIGAFPREDRIIFLILLLLLVISPYIPFPGLQVTPSSEASYAAVENVPDGGAFMWATDFTMATWYEMEPAETAIFKHMMMRAQDDGCKIVFVTTYEADGFFAQQKVLNEQAQPGDYDLVYGDDYVILGWVPGYESSQAGLMSDLAAITGGKDYQGTSLNDLPMMANINGAGDIHLLGYSTSTSPDPYARQWGVGTGVNNVELKVPLKDGSTTGAQLIGSMGTATVPWIMPYIDAGVQTSYVSGQRGGAEYEQLLGVTGTGSGFMSGQSIGHFYAIALIIGTNVMYMLEKRK